MRRSTRLGITSATLIIAGLIAGWTAAALVPTASSDHLEFTTSEGYVTTGLPIGLLFVFIGGSLATGVANPRPGRRGRVRTAKQHGYSAAGQRRAGTQLDRNRRWAAALQAALPELVQVRSRTGQQHSAPAGGRPSPHPSDQSHLLGVREMPTTPTPRPAPTPVGPISADMDGLGRETPHGPIGLHLVLTMVYRADHPYDINLVIAPKRRPSCGHDPAVWAISTDPWCATCDHDLARWLVSREVLCSAAMWQTPAGMGDFRAVPMAETVTQLVFIAGDPEYRGESLYVDVQRRSLLSFLERTIRAVKPGRESKHMDMDRIVAALLSSNTR